MSKLQKTDCTRAAAGLPGVRRVSGTLKPFETPKLPKRRYTAGMKIIRLLIGTAACLLALAANAQWQWLDKDGHRVFSDRAPPSDIPEKNILKKPGSRSSFTAAPAATPTAAAPAPAAPAQSGEDKALQDKKKQAEAAEAAKRKADEERIARAMAENCTRARQAKAGLDAGGRMSRISETGEREFMDESAIAAEGQRLQGIINENCK